MRRAAFCGLQSKLRHCCTGRVGPSLLVEGTVDHADSMMWQYATGSGVERSSARAFRGHPPEVPTHGLEGGDPHRELGGVLLDQ